MTPELKLPSENTNVDSSSLKKKQIASEATDHINNESQILGTQVQSKYLCELYDISEIPLEQPGEYKEYTCGTHPGYQY